MAGCRPSPTHKMVDALIEETLFNFNVSKRNNFSELDKRMSLFNASKDVSLSGIKGDDLSEIFDEAAADAARQNAKANKKKTLGPGWFNLAPAELTEELRQDLKMLRLRNFVDPKRFYKAPVGMTQVLHVGTVVEGTGDPSRLTRRERKRNITEEIMADDRLKDYSKRTYLDIQKKNADKIRPRGGGKNAKKAKRALF